MMNNNNNSGFNIILSDVGKKYNNRWIFNKVNLTFQAGERIAIQGSNGSGKSTFLQILSGFITPNQGEVKWLKSNNIIEVSSIYKHIAFASPYIDLIEEFTLKENVDFFIKMKPFQEQINSERLIEFAEIANADKERIKHFSSGMKQRLKIALAILSDTEILLLDEPLSNLDKNGYKWYLKLSEKYIKDRIAIVCSNNVVEETAFCNKTINIENYKTGTANV